MTDQTEWTGRDYNQVSRMQQTLALECLAAVALQGSERVLDVGCGDGKITAEIAARVPDGSALGVDRSHDMVAFASEHFGPAAHPNLRFAVADAASLQFRNEFDLVVSFHALHWVHEQAAALRGIRAALKPDGRALLLRLSRDGGPGVLDLIDATRQSPRWTEHFPGFQKPYALFTAAEYRALAESAGLRVERLEETEIAWDFQTRAAYLDFCRATFVNWTMALPESERDAFITDTLARFRAEAPASPAEDNTFRFRQLAVVLTPAGQPTPEERKHSRGGAVDNPGGRA